MNGVYINDIFYCPHHPKKGFKGEIKKFKIICRCRKPKIGLILQAKKKYNINLKKSYFIGNSAADYLCAKQAQIKYINISKSGNVGKASSYGFNIKSSFNKIRICFYVDVLQKKTIIKEGILYIGRALETSFL